MENIDPPAESLIVRVVLADDHPLVRNGIARKLGCDPEIQLVGEACNGDEALQLVELLHPDVLLLDMEMPGMNGVQVTQVVRKKFPLVHILALSGHEDRVYVLEILKMGASGYLTKDEALDTIIEAVKGVARGEVGWLSRRISALISTWLHRDELDPKALTQRELAVLRLVSTGSTNKRIALELHISEKTVEKYLESILTKLGVHTRVEAAVYAVRNNLVNKPVE